MAKKNDPLKQHLSTLGRKGGSKTSDRKKAAVRANGKKGGRPKKKPELFSCKPCKPCVPGRRTKAGWIFCKQCGGNVTSAFK